MRKTIRLLFCCAALIGAPSALAQIQLIMSPTYAEADVGDTVTFDVVLDSLGASVLGGGWDVVYDPTQLELIDYSIEAEVEPQFIGRPEKTPGRLIDLSIFSFNGYPSSPFVIATVTFRVIQSGTSTASIEPSTGLSTVWGDATDFGTFYTPVGQSGRIILPGTTYPLMRLDGFIVSDGIAPGSTVDIPVSVHNDGTGGLTVNSISLSGHGPGSMTIGEDPCTGTVVPAGGQCDVILSFDSTHDVAYSATSRRVTFDTSDDISLRRTTRVTARLRRAIIGLPAVEILGAPLGGPGIDKRVTITNVGDWPTTLGELTIDDPQSPGFALSVPEDQCSFQLLDIGESCSIRFRFFAQQIGRLTTRYRQPYSDGAFFGFADLAGYSVTGIPIVDFDGPRDLAVPSGTSLTRRITVTNKGSLPLTLDREPQSEGAFVVVSNSCIAGAPIAPDASCHVDVQITPESEDPITWLWFSTTDSVYRGFISAGLIVNARAPRPAVRGRLSSEASTDMRREIVH